jgi:hypothetical protein
LCVDIRKRVGGGNGSELKRVRDDGREEISRGDDGEVITQLYDRSVVRRVETHEETGVAELGGAARERLCQRGGAKLAGAATEPGSVIREIDRLGRSVNSGRRGTCEKGVERAGHV